MIRWVALLAGLALWLSPVAAQDWRREFDDVCAMTQDAMALSADDLRKLMLRCDKLKPLIDQLEESPRKVYSRKLQVCRNLYQFVLDSKMGT